MSFQTYRNAIKNIVSDKLSFLFSGQAEKRERQLSKFQQAAKIREHSDDCPKGGFHQWRPMDLHNVHWETCIKCGNCR